ncbi:glycosyltransferase family 39 protein [Nocardioides sp. YIM 152588]|uniref:ArnT family glycosyltransferase n=1 Tax=Nocardioides sp. YIM 152588 TaxID=3158259 RepID=UPI0032E49734
MVLTDERRAAAPPRPRRPDPRTLALVAIVATAFALRVVAVRHGLPHAYNPDEDLHYVPAAARAADGDWSTGYFENPAGFTHLLALCFLVVFGGQDVTALRVADPTAVFTVARLVAVVLGTLTVALVHLAGKRYADRATGLVAAALLATAYLPVFYSHQALNDVPAMAPTTVALIACLRVHQRGDLTGLLLAGAAVGVASGTKYLAAPMALVIALALLLRVVERRSAVLPALAGLGAAAAASIAGLLALNPYAVVEPGRFVDDVTGQSARVGGEKLGQSGSAWLGYPATLLWGLGVAAVAFALLGAVLLWRADRARALLLVTFPVALYVAMAAQERYFGRWLLPAYPALAVLAGYGVVRVARAVRSRTGPRAGLLATAGLLVALLAQPTVDAVRSDLLLTRTDTRADALAWTTGHVPPGSGIVVEPAVPGSYRRALRAAGLEIYPVQRPYEDYERTLSPALLDDYRSAGYCWVMVNGHQRDRGRAAGLLDAGAYYDRLRRESTPAFAVSPYSAGATPPPFSYDLSFNYYPPAFRRPGPVVEVRRLVGCAGAPDPA